MFIFSAEKLFDMINFESMLPIQLLVKGVYFMEALTFYLVCKLCIQGKKHCTLHMITF